MPALTLPGVLAATVFWDSAGTENDIGRAQGCTAGFNGIVRQLRRADRYPLPSDYFPNLADAIIAAGFLFERDALPN